MHRIRHWLHRPTLAAIAGSSLIALGLGACGGSSDTTTTATQAHAAITSSTRGTTTTGAQTGNRPAGATAKTPLQLPSKLRECLQRNGVKLPTGRGARGLFLNGGANSTQLRAATRKCLGAAGPLGRRARFPRATGSPHFKQALGNFAACMRKNGVNVPPPNTSGNGPVFSTKGLNTASAKFKAATAKCRTALTAGFRRPAGATAQPNGGR